VHVVRQSVLGAVASTAGADPIQYVVGACRRSLGWLLVGCAALAGIPPVMGPYLVFCNQTVQFTAASFCLVAAVRHCHQ